DEAVPAPVRPPRRAPLRGSKHGGRGGSEARRQVPQPLLPRQAENQGRSANARSRDLSGAGASTVDGGVPRLIAAGRRGGRAPV
ncbi:unnamed protein product, partial [Urochloa humidicola]